MSCWPCFPVDVHARTYNMRYAHIAGDPAHAQQQGTQTACMTLGLVQGFKLSYVIYGYGLTPLASLHQYTKP
jgi:hypothetical protein